MQVITYFKIILWEYPNSIFQANISECSIWKTILQNRNIYQKKLVAALKLNSYTALKYIDKERECKLALIIAGSIIESLY